MMNIIPGKYQNKLASPFMLIHGIRPNPRTWLPLFSVCYFHHKKDSDASRSKSQAHTMDRIVLGRSPTSNAILIYNPWNQRYYKSDSYKIDPYRVPSSVYPTIKYDGGLFISLHQERQPVHQQTVPPWNKSPQHQPIISMKSCWHRYGYPAGPQLFPSISHHL